MVDQGVTSIMQDWMQERETKLREFFELETNVDLLAPGVDFPEIPPRMAEHLANFNLEWHVIPSAQAVPFDAAYIDQLYPQRSRDFDQPHLNGPSYRAMLAQGHSPHQGRIIAVETTPKPIYLPGNQQYYGTQYGFDASADPLAPYMNFSNGTRYGHNYDSVKQLGNAINNHWRAAGLIPPGYRLTMCPPAVFNLIGTIFHPEWSATETLELGFYRDERDNASCFVVGCNGPGDFSHLRAIEIASDWTLLGFRAALLPE